MVSYKALNTKEKQNQRKAKNLIYMCWSFTAFTLYILELYI